MEPFVKNHTDQLNLCQFHTQFYQEKLFKIVKLSVKLNLIEMNFQQVKTLKL